MPDGKNNSSAMLVFWHTFNKDDDINNLRAEIDAVMDNFISKTEIIQAFTGVFGSFPLYGNGTVYENACGFDGSFSLLKKWCKSYLRLMSDCMWIGEYLSLKLPHEDSFKDIADFSKQGHAVRIKLNDIKKIGELEKLLMPILPDSEKYNDFIKNELQ